MFNSQLRSSGRILGMQWNLRWSLSKAKFCALRIPAEKNLNVPRVCAVDATGHQDR
jgi:hypothetical protein